MISSGCFSHATSVTVRVAGTFATPCRVQSGYQGEVLDGLELAGGLRQHAQDLALTVHGMDRALFQRRFQRAERQVVLVVALQLVLIGVLPWA